MDRFESLLEGAHAMDRHFRTAPLETNAPVLLGLLGVWYRNFLGCATQAVLPYEQYLHRLPAYLQQLDMESNGKRTDRAGRPVDYDTGPVVWGEPGTNGQHAFFQLLHQGTQIVPADFILAARGTHDFEDHHDILLANCIAQSQALAFGKTEAEAREEMIRNGIAPAEADRLAPYRAFPGNRPSTTIVMDRLAPETLGALIALFEHRVFVQATLWNINPFDQWGVELGKQLAGAILTSLRTGSPATNFDGSTRGLLDRIVQHA
jgi:glucose-6-phosphate isomerase